MKRPFTIALTAAEAKALLTTPEVELVRPVRALGPPTPYVAKPDWLDMPERYHRKGGERSFGGWLLPDIGGQVRCPYGAPGDVLLGKEALWSTGPRPGTGEEMWCYQTDAGDAPMGPAVTPIEFYPWAPRSGYIPAHVLFSTRETSRGFSLRLSRGGIEPRIPPSFPREALVPAHRMPLWAVRLRQRVQRVGLRELEQADAERLKRPELAGKWCWVLTLAQHMPKGREEMAAWLAGLKWGEPVAVWRGVRKARTFEVGHVLPRTERTHTRVWVALRGHELAFRLQDGGRVGGLPSESIGPVPVSAPREKSGSRRIYRA